MKTRILTVIMMGITTLAAAASQPSFRTIDIQGPAGRLVADIHKPDIEDGAKADLVIQMHGFKANRRGPLLDSIFNTMASAGLGVLRFDFDGCGDSDGTFVDIVVPYTYSLRYKEIFRNGTVDLLYGVDHRFSGHEQQAADLAKTYLTLTAADYCL